MMPPRVVWKIRPSGVVPYFLMWGRLLVHPVSAAATELSGGYLSWAT
jgi:hypothetical protein